MNPLLIVSPCPNCGVDAGKHNKILYDGIFLICHNCGYGWYYKVEVTRTANNHSYNSKSAPLNTLKTVHNIQKTRNINHNTHMPAKSNVVHSSNLEKYQTNHSNGQNNSNPLPHNSKKILSQPISSNVQPINYTDGKYTSNVYYAPTDTINNHQESKHTNNNKQINSFAKNNEVPLKPNMVYSNVNKNNNNIQHFHLSNTEKHLTANNTDGKSSKKPLNKVINLNIKTPVNTASGKNTVIDFNVLPNTTPINQNTENSKKLKNQSAYPINKTPIGSVNNSSIVNNVHYNSTNNTKDNNNFNKSSNTNVNKIPDLDKPSVSKSNKSIPVELPTKNDYTEHKPSSNTNNNLHGNTLDNTSQLLKKVDEVTDDFAYQSSVDSSHHSPKLDLDNYITKFKKENFSKAIDHFNHELTHKENLGLDPRSLLNIEEKSEYNITEYKQPPLKLKSFIPQPQTILNSIKSGYSSTLQGLILLFTRLDILLRFLAYVLIIGGSIGFLFYLNHKKHTKIKETEIFNSSYNTNIASEPNSNVSFNKNSNLNAIAPLNNNEQKNQPRLSHSRVVNDPDSIVAVEKHHYGNDKQNRENANLENSPNLMSKEEQPPETFIENIKYKFNYSILTLKQIKSNLFSKVKIFQNNISWIGEYNNILASKNIISNNDKYNSYLIKSVEIIFLSNTGNTIGKRIIVTNQLLNNNSVVELNLKINNPPSGTNTVFVYIKERSKL